MTSPRALALLAGLASPIFLIAAVAAWITGVWPANPLTLAVAAAIVVAGPILGMVHIALADHELEEEDELEAAFVATPVAPQPVMTPKAASAKAFHNWRDSSNTAIAHRERERRANQYLRA